MVPSSEKEISVTPAPVVLGGTVIPVAVFCSQVAPESVDLRVCMGIPVPSTPTIIALAVTPRPRYAHVGRLLGLKIIESGMSASCQLCPRLVDIKAVLLFPTAISEFSSKNLILRIISDEGGLYYSPGLTQILSYRSHTICPGYYNFFTIPRIDIQYIMWKRALFFPNPHHHCRI